MREAAWRTGSGRLTINSGRGTWTGGESNSRCSGYWIAARLSGGEQQMLAIARTLMGNPALLPLDEPSEGLAPIIVQRIGELLRQLRGIGATVLIAEQNMHFCLRLATQATVFDKGQIVHSGTIDDLKTNEDIRRRYLAL